MVGTVISTVTSTVWDKQLRISSIRRRTAETEGDLLMSQSNHIPETHVLLVTEQSDSPFATDLEVFASLTTLGPRAAADYLRDNAVALVLLDQAFDAALQSAQSLVPLLGDTPLFLVSDQADSETLDAVLEAGGDDVWLRPVAARNAQRYLAQHHAPRTIGDLGLYQAALDNALESVVITDAQLSKPGPRIVYVNQSFQKMTGYSYDEAIGKTPRMLQGINTDHDMLGRLRETLERGQRFEGETVNYRKDGQPYVVEWNITPLRNEDGVITHFASAQRDLTERKKLGQTLQQISGTLQETRSALGLEPEIPDSAPELTYQVSTREDAIDLTRLSNTLQRLLRRAKMNRELQGRIENKGGARDLLHTLGLIEPSGALHLADAGVIYLSRGRIVHVAHTEYRGRDALRALLSVNEGEFRLEPDVTPSQQSLDLSLLGFVLEQDREEKYDEAQPKQRIVVPSIAAALALITSAGRHEHFQVESEYDSDADKTYVAFRSDGVSVISLTGTVTDVPKDALRTQPS